jgi:Tol biopolymer transport system component
MHTCIFSVLIFSCTLTCAYAQQQHAYPGGKIATGKAELFAEGLVSDGMNNRDFTMSPDGNEIFFTVQQKDMLVSAIVRLYKKNGKWGKPELASFSGRYKDLEASFSPDGKRIWFASNRPSAASDSTDDFDIWFVERNGSGWGEPVHAGNVVNTSGNEFYPSVARNGNLYFTSEFKAGKGKEDIVMCAWANGAFQAPVSLPEAINSRGYEFNAFIDPDERFLLFTGYGRADDMGKGDLYISKRDAAGNWLPANTLGASVNSKYLDYCPFISPDKKVLFFTSNRPSVGIDRKNADYNAIAAALKGAGNGFDDIYWIKWDE